MIVASIQADNESAKQGPDPRVHSLLRVAWWVREHEPLGGTASTSQAVRHQEQSRRYLLLSQQGMSFQ